MAGRQVVQVYLSKPAGKLDAPRQELCAFAKTRTLAPGEAETVTCSFTLPEMAAYDAETASYILEAGDHLVRVGVSSAETVPAAVLHLGKTVTTLQAKNVLGSSRMLRTLITGERSTTPPTFSTSIKRVNFLSSARISRTSESVRRMSPLSGVRSLPSPEMRETT